MPARRAPPRQHVGFLTASDVESLHAELYTEWVALDNVVRTCNAPGEAWEKALPDFAPKPTSKLAATDVAAWDALSKEIAAYRADAPSTMSAGAQVEKGRAFQAALAPWYAKLKDAGCANVPPAPAHIVPKEEETSVQTLTKGLGNFGELLKWLAIAYVAHEFLGR